MSTKTNEILFITSKTITFENLLDEYHFSYVSFDKLSADCIEKVMPRLIFISPDSDRELKDADKFLNDLSLEIFENTPIFIIFENPINDDVCSENYKLCFNFNFKINEKNLIALINIGKSIVDKISQIVSLEEDVYSTQQYLSNKIDYLLLVDYCLQKISNYITTEDVITNTLKILTNKKLFGFDDACFYFCKKDDKYKYYQNNNGNAILECSEIPEFVQEAFENQKTKKTDNCLASPMIIANKVFGVVYCKLNETKDQNIILITISFLIHINLKLRICELQMFTEELKQINQSKDTFLSLISHEMRTPLTIILPSLSTLSDLVQEFESEEDKEMFNYILDGMIVSSNRLHKIVEEIIMYISLSSHSMPSEVIEVAPTYICQEYFDHKREKIESEGIEYTTSYVEDVTEYDLDLNLFNKGLDIILSNAIKFKGNNPFIKVTTTCGENYYEVEIADNGIGMTEEEVDKVFQSFEMVEDIEHHQEGLGINLSIAQLIFETYHKGKLEVISKKGEGTQVKIKIFKN